MANLEAVLSVDHLNFFYNKDTKVLNDVDFDIYRNKVTALIGPSGCGKTTLLRCFNRIHDLHDEVIYDGKILFKQKNILEKNIDVIELRSKIGMVFQKPTPFPMSIYDNIAFGLKLHGLTNKTEMNHRIEEALKKAALFDEVKDKLNKSALALSGGQQQRLVIARAIAVEPEVLLMDEPTSALDPVSTAKIEELIEDLKKQYSILIVTHNMQQASRISDYTGFMLLGDLVEYDETKQIFINPANEKTERYISGQFG
jgi:phosphate transport system ATP-binding protein